MYHRATSNTSLSSNQTTVPELMQVRPNLKYRTSLDCWNSFFYKPDVQQVKALKKETGKCDFKKKILKSRNKYDSNRYTE